MILSELKSYLKKNNQRPKKSLSQNFLVDANIPKKMVGLAQIEKGEQVLEIGPGLGAITKILLEKGAQVYCIEKDHFFSKELSRYQNGNLKVYEDDILTFPLENLPKHLKVVANLPYKITTPILERLFLGSFESITIVVQKEVAMRMKAKTGKSFGPLSIFVQFYSTVEDFFLVPRNCFYPVPNVDSCVIKLCKKSPPNIDPIQFFELIRSSFQKRRKMLKGTLNFEKEVIEKSLSAIGVRTDARPENLSFEKWIDLFKDLRNKAL